LIRFRGVIFGEVIGKKGGHCLVAWDRVSWLIEMGGLDILNLKMLGWALRKHWIWLKKTEPNDLCFDEWVFIPLRLQNEETKRI
jgi:hypothetical protein